ncbi:prolyl oligopeptidase family serine peptidase [Actinoplanes sp. TRM 88003]|uniref:Prolyl oligopeptidase family serine peptidase n=1 Tax=Paractinoplanes aksuensis TaxID=2939490 RepID=A0ABT1E141_9ACTN|nr:prolyl oligopeptidase family serine peptidase [Actinoplanes aksuensis]MCO8276803.1 prolyl oligopeptidase family serine peptidase [Actinoplanes aksuensis]
MSVDAFHDLDSYVRLPRVAGLWLSPDGRRLVVGVGTLVRTALWQVDPDGERPARQLTYREQSVACAGFTPSGDLLFTSSGVLWRQPEAGGEAYEIAKLPGGIHGVRVSAAGTIVAGSAVLPSGDDSLGERRRAAGVSAILHESFPVRYWDHDLGPERPRLMAGSLDDAVLRDLTGHVGHALDNQGDWEITPDGRGVVTAWERAEPGGAQRSVIVVIDVATGERRVLADEAGQDCTAPRVSPDGARVAFLVRRWATPDDPGHIWVASVPLTGGPVESLTRGWEHWPHSPRWTPDGTALIVAADDNGRSPLWRVDATTGKVTRITHDDAAYTVPRVSPDGRFVYALRSTIAEPPHPVRVSLISQQVRPLPGPAAAVDVPGRLTEVTARAADGSPLRAWLALPTGAETLAPLVLWVHGGPLASWNTWKWNSNPWPAVARGYAVLMPDPALSTGYGLDFLRRGWGAWGDTPYTDLMAITDAALGLPEVDSSRTAAVGSSFGGYMANWIAGHTTRFDAIVSSASMWALDQMMATTDFPYYWLRELTPERLEANSPHRAADAITTPMLVMHGDEDYRVPIGEALRLWRDLQSRATDDRHKFLYFPDDGHIVAKPGHLALWHATMLAFLDHHVRGEPWQPPPLLG